MRPPRIPRDELANLLIAGVPDAEIARRHGVSRSAVCQAKRKIPAGTWLAAVRARMATPLGEPTESGARGSDVLGLLTDVRNELHDIRVFLRSDEARAQLPLGSRLTLQFAAADRVLRLVDRFVSTNAQLLQLAALDIWLDELCSLLETLEPRVVQQFMERVRAHYAGRNGWIVPAARLIPQGRLPAESASLGGSDAAGSGAR